MVGYIKYEIYIDDDWEQDFDLEVFSAVTAGKN